MTPITDSAGARTGVLVGRTDLVATNLFFEPITIALNSLTDSNGDGMLIDKNGTILYSTSSDWVMSSYTGQTANQGIPFEGVDLDGTQSMMFYKPVRGRTWAVIESVPVQEAQQLALQIAAPLLIMILIFFSIAVLVC